MLLAAAQYLIEQFDPKPVEEIVQVEVDYDLPPEADIVADTPVFVSNLTEPTTLSQYESLLKRASTPDPILINHKQLAEKFVYQYCRAPHIVNLSEDQLRQDGVQDHIAVSYVRKPTEGDPFFWMICVLTTAYGNIYISTTLDEDGYIPDNTVGVFVTYDTQSTEMVLHGVVAEHAERFKEGTHSFQSTIQSEQELAFMLGDAEHGFTVAQYLT